MLECAALDTRIIHRKRNGILVNEVGTMKSEPDVYSIDDLERDGREMWDSIRNYQARNMMRDEMRVGDEIFFYHSNCKEPGIVGIG
jgi:predicted RNA-binding protein with PUA-like domain